MHFNEIFEYQDQKPKILLFNNYNMNFNEKMYEYVKNLVDYSQEFFIHKICFVL